MLSEMNAKAQGVEKSTGRENAPLYARACGDLARDVGERIGRIRYDEQHRVRGCARDARNNVAIDRAAERASSTAS